MIHEIMELLPAAVNRIQAPVALAIAGVGLLIGVTGARFSRAIVALSLVSAGTVIGLHMPKWFGWGIDPMGTAFGMAIVLGISGYVLTTLWEGILFSGLLAAAAGLGAWMKLAQHQTWQLPPIDWSTTAVEIASHVRLSLPSALTTVLPVILGIAATVGALFIVIWQRLGRVLLYGLLGMSILTIAGIIGLKQLRPEWVAMIPQDSWTQGFLFGILVILSATIQWLLLPRRLNPQPAPTSGNKLHLNQFVAKGPALRVQAAESRVLMNGAGKGATVVRPEQIPSRIR